MPILFRLWHNDARADLLAYVMLVVTACRVATERQVTADNLRYLRELLALFGQLTPLFEHSRSFSKKGHLLQHLPDAMERLGPCFEMSAFGCEVGKDNVSVSVIIRKLHCSP